MVGFEPTTSPLALDNHHPATLSKRE